MGGKYQIRIRSLRSSVRETRDRSRLVHTNAESKPADYETIADRFLGVCRVAKHRVAVADGRGQHSYHWLACQAGLIARAIVDQPNYHIGDPVGIWIDNSPEYVAALFGAHLAGAVAVPIPVYHRGSRLEQLCQLAELNLVLDAPTIPGGEVDFACNQAVTFDLSAKHFARPNAARETQPNALAMLLFTSGSTGAPKAVMLSQRNVLANTASILQFLPIDSNDRAHVVTSLAHALGNSVLHTHLLTGAELFFPEKTQFPTEQLAQLAQHRCTTVAAVPEYFESLLIAMGSDTARLPCLKFMAVAGGKMDANQAVQLQQHIAPAKFFVMYGQTEATARLSWLPPELLLSHPQTIGHAIPTVELAVFDDFGQPVSVGHTGILHARGPNIMQGYWNDEDATQSVLCNGWLNTGDLARQSPNGLLEICGRQNGLIKIQGYRFHPGEIEQMLSDRLAHVQLVATPIDFLGRTRLALFAKSRSSNPVSRQEVQSACRQTLPRHMLPQRYEIVERWPLTASNKIDLQALIGSLL